MHDVSGNSLFTSKQLPTDGAWSITHVLLHAAAALLLCPVVHVFLKSEPLAFVGCVDGQMSPSNGQLAVGGTLDVSIALKEVICEKRTSALDIADLDGYRVKFSLEGPGQVVDTSDTTKQPGRQDPQTQFDATISNGAASFSVKATGPGSIVVTALTWRPPPDMKGFESQFSNAGSGDLVTTITATNVQPTVVKVLLAPAKAYRRCGDPITFTATAYNTQGAAVPSVNVGFAVFGDCSPEYDTKSALTNAAGSVSVKVSSHKPCAVAVVAAVSTSSGVVFSAPSHVIYFEEHEDLDRRERDYYGPDHHDRCGSSLWYLQGMC